MHVPQPGEDEAAWDPTVRAWFPRVKGMLPERRYSLIDRKSGRGDRCISVSPGLNTSTEIAEAARLVLGRSGETETRG